MRETGESIDIAAFSVVMTKAKEVANTVRTELNHAYPVDT